MSETDDHGLQRAAEILPVIAEQKALALAPPKAPGRIQQRLLSMPLDEEASILYQHSVLCQTSIPYHNPGDDVRTWLRRNGRIRMELLGGRVLDPNIDEVVDVGLPFGSKPRLVLYHLNAEALRTQSPVIELEDSLTAFVKRTLGLDVGGRTIRTVKDQLNRLAAADFRFYASHEGHAVTLKGTVIEGLDLWVSKNERQRVLWPSVVQFSLRYFESLMEHAVPLNEAAVSRLSHSAMALDVYTWLAQRLHRIDRCKPAFIPWASLWEQFGQGYRRIVDFRRFFRRTLGQVKVVYPEACYSLDAGGARLFNSPPPVPKRLIR
jgi:hypothetical protein